LSLFLEYQQLNSGTNQSWFKLQAVLVFRSDWCKTFFHILKMSSHTPGGRRTLVEDHLSRKCGNLDVSQTYRPRQPLIVIALLSGTETGWRAGVRFPTVSRDFMHFTVRRLGLGPNQPPTNG
jgi:hypothetical protein